MKLLFNRWIHAFLFTLAFSASADDSINIMTLNQYLGADLTPILSAPDPGTFNNGLVAVLTQTAKSNFRSRALAQADAIMMRKPDALALQEVWELRCQDFDFNPAKGCEDPQIAEAFTDHLQLTLAALEEKGFKYNKVALIKNLDLGKIHIPEAPVAGIPFDINGVTAFLVAVDRDAILVRDGIDAQPIIFPPSLCPIPSVDGCNYQTAAEAITPVGKLRVERGFMAINAKIGGKNYRIFNTHLEVKGEDVNNPLFTYYQAAQAYELTQVIGFSAISDRKTLLLGDMNSSPVQENPDPGIITPYNQFTAADYFDIWNLRPADLPGYTCCQNENLENRKSALNERIDMVFAVDDPARTKNIRVIGDNSSTKTKPQGLGLWFSDHSAVAANLQF
jgi:endonuclease/exonuclease/phosphatase family metal-dependent hydrolase